MRGIISTLLMVICLPSIVLAAPIDDVNRAAFLIRNKDYATAKPLLLNVAASNEATTDVKANAYYMLSAIEDNQNDALMYIKKSIEFLPENSTYHLQYGTILYKDKKYSDSVLEITKSIEISPVNDRSYSLRGIAYRELGDFQKALDDLTKAISLNGNASIHYLRRGVLYYKMNKYDDAMKDFSDATGKNISEQQLGEILYYTGNIYLRKNDLQQSEFALKKAYRLLSDEIKKDEIKSILDQMNAMKEWM